MVEPPVYQSMTPLSAVLVPSVVTIELNSNRAMSTPLTAPSKVPISTPAPGRPAPAGGTGRSRPRW